MATVNFYLKDRKSKDDTLIYLIFRFQGQTLKYSTGEKILPKSWNTSLQRAKKTSNGHSELNFYLDKVSEEITKLYRTDKTNVVELSPDSLREQLNKSLNNNTTKKKGFFDYLSDYIEVQKGKVTKGTVAKYHALYNTLHNFQQSKKFKLSFDNMNLAFYDKFELYLNSDLGLLNNTKAKYFKTLKAFLNWATEREYNTKIIYKKFRSSEQDADIISLTDDELMSLYSFDLSTNERLSNVRDVFCFACFTGLRYSDIARLRKVNVTKDEIQITMQKTKERISIPLNDFSKEILERHDYRLTIISNQKMNDYLKELGKLAGINDEIVVTKFRGIERIQFKEPKYNFLSTHTGRRTFVTLSLEKGMRAEMVMSITGHKTYSSFKRYIEITNSVKKVEMQRIWNKEPKLKIV